MRFQDDSDSCNPDPSCGCTGFSGAAGCGGSPCWFAISFIRGDTFSLEAQYEEDGTPVDITGATVTMTAKTTFDVPDSAAVFTLSSPASGITITDPTLGMFVVSIPSTATLQVPLSSSPMVYDIVVTNGASRVTVFRGSITLLRNVSN